MRTRLRRALLEARMRSIRRELENLDELRAGSQPAPFERADDTHVIAMIREHEGDLLRDLERLSELMREQESDQGPCAPCPAAQRRAAGGLYPFLTCA